MLRYRCRPRGWRVWWPMGDTECPPRLPYDPGRCAGWLQAAALIASLYQDRMTMNKLLPAVVLGCLLSLAVNARNTSTSPAIPRATRRQIRQRKAAAREPGFYRIIGGANGQPKCILRRLARQLNHRCRLRGRVTAITPVRRRSFSVGDHAARQRTSTGEHIPG